MRALKEVILSGLVALSAAAAAQATPGSAPARSDVPEGHWARPAVENLYRLGILQGYPDGSFRGTRPVSRYELAIVVTNVHDRFRQTLSSQREQSDSVRQLPAAQYAHLAAIRRHLDSLRVDVASVQALRTETQALTTGFEGLSQQMRSLQSELESMRARIKN